MLGWGGSKSSMLVKPAAKCVVCGKKATAGNIFNLPGCVDHLILPTKVPKCPECDLLMLVKMGKERAFWSCPEYPHCFGTRNLLKPDEEMNIL